MTTTPVIDFHNHIGRFGYLAMDDDPDRFLRIMDTAGVDIACVFCIWYGDFIRGNDITAQYVSRHPDRFVGAGYISPAYPEDNIAELERIFDKLALKFLKLYPKFTAAKVLDDDAYIPVFEWANDRGIVIMSHHDDWPKPLKYINLARQFPNVKWVISHGGNGLLAQQEAVEAAQTTPNIYLEISSSWGDHKTIQFLTEGAGDDRLLFGSDMPEQDVRHHIGRVLTADISNESKRKILGLNAAKLLEISV